MSFPAQKFKVHFREPAKQAQMRWGRCLPAAGQEGHLEEAGGGKQKQAETVDAYTVVEAFASLWVFHTAIAALPATGYGGESGLGLGRPGSGSRACMYGGGAASRAHAMSSTTRSRQHEQCCVRFR